MSKYIRTKDKIYEIDFSRNETNICYFTTRGYVYKSDVIKTNDTIEDLMDEYVVDCKHKDSIEKHPFVYTLPKNIKAYYLDLLQDIKEATIIYGAIWTDKGLIYVAKMNKYGEWELK